MAAGRIKTLSFCLSLHSQSSGASHCPMGPCRQVAQRQRICLQCRRPGFDPWVRKMPWRRKWQPTPVFLPGESHGQKSLMDCSPWGCKESDTTECSHKTSQDGDIYIYIYIYISDEPLLIHTYILNILILFLFFSEYLKSF